MKRLVPLALAAALLVLTGCHLFSSKKKPSEPPPDTKTTAADVEREFMHRWVEKRASELSAQGIPADAAHAQATVEFKKEFTYMDATR